MSLEEIEKLKEKLNKDPNSKLFILLAEEYKKEGMLDESIAVLTQGLEKHPRYMSAHVSLGKIYLEQGILDKAKEEFKEVVSAIPDNLYAHKKLAEIHKDLVEIDEAIDVFKTVLRLNPGDEEAANSLAELEKGLTVEPENLERAKSEESTSIESEPAVEKETSPEIPINEQDIEYSSKTLFEEEKTGEEVTEQEKLSEKEKLLSENILEDSGVALEEISEIPHGENQLSEISITEEDIDDLSKVLLEASKEEIEEVITEEEKEELSEEEIFSPEEIFKEPGGALEEKPEPLRESLSEQPGLSIVDADIYISQGRYMNAMDIYKRLLSIDPGNVHVMQRIEDMKILLKLLGKDKEQIIAKLNSFLEGIKKRQNEFFRNP
ncbi:MAG: tetratricopeptide repeat protein [Nitrospirota bacterium]|nr:tetratricopeptide repeat protein [Nitrospirota bacterium]MDH5767528.1 tetratricopeptide repeat protein [Nitrospirota bacterium]